MRHGIQLALALGVSTLFAACQPSAPLASAAAEPALTSDEDKIFYALGLAMAKNVEPFRMTAEELERMKLGLTDGALGRPEKVALEEFGPRIRELAASRAKLAASEETKASEDFLAKAASEPGAQRSETGLVYREITAGSGAQPAASDTVKVHYHGTLRDGTVFDSSVERGEPAEFPLDRVIPCWTEAVQRMHVGGKAHIVCPAQIAYGDHGAPPKIKPGAALSFDVELIEIVK